VGLLGEEDLRVRGAPFWEDMWIEIIDTRGETVQR
jgi:hypothetical protein